MDSSDQDGEYNPFEEASVSKVLNSNFTSAQTNPSTLPSSTPMIQSSQLSSTAGDENKRLEEKLREIEQREREIIRSNQELQQREQAQRAYNPGQTPINNFPAFPDYFPIKPLFYINIEVEIPLLDQMICENAKKFSYGFLALLVANIIVMVSGLVVGMGSGLSHFLWAILTGIIMAPICVYFFFIRFYYALKGSGSLSYILFFSGSLAIGIYLLTFVIGLSQGMAGWGFVHTNFKGDEASRSKLAGILGILTSLGSSALLIICFIVARTGYAKYKSVGGTIQGAREEAGRTVPGAMLGSAVSSMR